MIIKSDDLQNPLVVAILEEHIADMYRTSPPESVHTLDLDSLRMSDINLWVVWDQQTPAGCIALKQHDVNWAEIKSMRTSNAYRGKGIGKLLLEHVLDVAIERKYQYLRLETGQEDFFEPARTIYSRYGFEVIGPFADYTNDPNSVFMEKQISCS